MDETLIARTINILKKYLKRLGIKNIAITNKLLIFKGDFLILRNVTRTIYLRQEELYPIEKFQFIKPIAGLFHLQMNVLKLFIDTTWGKKDNQVSLTHFQETLSQKKITQDAKDFHISDNFFQTVMTGFTLALYMQDILCSEIPKFKTWSSKNNWRKMVENIEDKYLDLFKIIQIQASTTE